MPDQSFIYSLFDLVPLECLEPAFMRQAFVALLLLAPMTGILGIHVLNFRMSFFSDAIGHSAFAGLALGLLLGAPPQTAVLVFGVIVGLFIMAVWNSSRLSADAAIGIVFSAVVAFGLAVVSRAPGLSRDIQQYLYGDILTVGPDEIAILAIMLLVLIAFEFFGWNKMLHISLSTELAKIAGIAIKAWQYAFAAILALVVMFSVRVVGVLLVTALLVVPAATARNVCADMRSMFWWSIVISVFSALGGLLLSAQEWLATASGATIILLACSFFVASALWAKISGAASR